MYRTIPPGRINFQWAIASFIAGLRRRGSRAALYWATELWQEAALGVAAA